MNSTSTPQPEEEGEYSTKPRGIFDELEDALYHGGGATVTPYLYALHCGFVPVVIILYPWVLFVLVWWRKHFTNPFYKLAIGLGLCNIYNQLWLCYVFAYTYLGRSPFGIERADAIFAASSWVMWFANLYFQVCIATNRLLAIVCYESYFLLFTPTATLICFFVCFALSGIQIAPLFGSHPVAFNLSEGIDRFIDSDDQFAHVWEWLEALITAILLIYISFCYLATLCFVRRKLRAVANRMALMNEIKLTAASFIIVIFLIIYNVVDFLRMDFIYIRTLEVLYHGIPPFVYLLFDRKLRRHMLWCQCVRTRLYFNQNGAFETLTVSGRQMSGRVNKKYRRMRVMNNSAENSSSNDNRASRAVSGV